LSKFQGGGSIPFVSLDPPADPYESFVRLFVAHEARLRGLLRALLPSWEDVDDVLQETSLVAWRKFEQFEQFESGSDFMAWAGTIARFEALRHARAKARDRLVFGEDLLERIAAEGLEENERREREHRALRRCLEKLPETQARALELAYRPGIKFHEAARLAGKPVQGFYKTLQRLRAALESCVRSELKTLGDPAP